jgi:hypothetical protein
VLIRDGARRIGIRILSRLSIVATLTYLRVTSSVC